MNNAIPDTKTIIECYEKRLSINALARSICVKFSINPYDMNLVGALGAPKSANNLYAVSSWISEQSTCLDRESFEKARSELFIQFERYWGDY